VILIEFSPDLVNKFFDLLFVNFLSNGLLNVLDLNSSDQFDKLLHLSLADLSIVVFIDFSEDSVELLLWESIGLINLGKVGDNKASHLALGELS
jgi:hypothetical protein